MFSFKEIFSEFILQFIECFICLCYLNVSVGENTLCEVFG